MLLPCLPLFRVFRVFRGSVLFKKVEPRSKRSPVRNGLVPVSCSVFFVCLRVSSWLQTFRGGLKPLTHTKSHQKSLTFRTYNTRKTRNARRTRILPKTKLSPLTGFREIDYRFNPNQTFDRKKVAFEKINYDFSHFRTAQTLRPLRFVIQLSNTSEDHLL